MYISNYFCYSWLFCVFFVESHSVLFMFLLICIFICICIFYIFISFIILIITTLHRQKGYRGKSVQQEKAHEQKAHYCIPETNKEIKTLEEFKILRLRIWLSPHRHSIHVHSERPMGKNTWKIWIKNINQIRNICHIKVFFLFL